MLARFLLCVGIRKVHIIQGILIMLFLLPAILSTLLLIILVAMSY